MIDILQEIVSTYLIPAVITALGGVATWIVTKIKKIYEDKVENEEIRKIVFDVVNFVERTAKSEDNTVKFNLALEKASEWLNTKGFNVDATELSLLIEASVNNLPKTEKEE